MEQFTFFWQSGSPFSQWYIRNFIVGAIRFNCCEQYMMYSKAMLFGDTEIAEKILDTDSPEKQKALGRQVRGFRRDVWEKHCMDIVYKGNQAKFTQNSDLLSKLLATKGTTIVEASPYDKIWGIGLDANHPDAKNPAKWPGKNKLGKVLTKLREDLLTNA